MIPRIGIVLLFAISCTTGIQHSQEHERIKRQSSPQYQYVSFEIPNNTNAFQFPPPSTSSHDHPHSFDQLSQFQNQFLNFQNSRAAAAADQLGTNSIRRFPQFPNASPANEEPLISVLSGSNQFHPSQSVSWNPPPTIVPPQVPPPQQASASSQQLNRGGSGLQHAPEPHFNPSHPEPVLPTAAASSAEQNLPPPLPPKSSSIHSSPLEESVPKQSRVNLQAGNSNVLDKPSTQSVPSSTASPPTTPKDKDKKDDVVIYYYYYYDDDKNKTDGGLDTIPSLEGFDTPTRNKPGKVIIKNDNYVPPPKSDKPQIIPLTVDTRLGGQAVPTHKTHQDFPVITTERPPSTQRASSTTPQDALISNIFRYGSSSVAPSNTPSSEPKFSQPEPTFNFEPNKVGLSSADTINKLPAFTLDKVSPSDLSNHQDGSTTPLQTTLRTTPFTTTTTTTTTTTPPSTTTTTTTTTTPAPTTAKESPGNRRFGNRRPGTSGGFTRPNPINRVRSTTTTTTTPAPATTERRSFTRPPAGSVNPQRNRLNRFKNRPRFGSTSGSDAAPEDNANSDSASSSAPSGVSSTTAAPRTESSTQSSRGRFGGRGRFGSNRQQPGSSNTGVSSTTASPSTSGATSSSSVASTTRRPFNSRGRPPLRGGRPNFSRNRNKQEEVTPAPSDESTPQAEGGNSSIAPADNAASGSPSAGSESSTESSAASDSSSSADSGEAASSTEKPGARGRQRPLFGSRPRPNLFGRRGSR